MSRRRRLPGEHGLSESVQWAVLTPLLALAVIGAIQVGIWLHGKNVAQEAATAAAEAVAATGSDQAGYAVAGRMTGDLREVRVGISSVGTVVVVTIDARTQTFLDLGQGYVRATASQPRESR